MIQCHAHSHCHAGCRWQSFRPIRLSRTATHCHRVTLRECHARLYRRVTLVSLRVGGGPGGEIYPRPGYGAGARASSSLTVRTECRTVVVMGRKGRRGGSLPRVGEVVATSRLELRLTAEQRAEWDALAQRLGLPTAEMVRAAVAAFADRDPDALADLGREVVALVRRHERRSS